MKSLLHDCDISSLKIAEVGCGHGLVQNQVESHWGNLVDGFDLNAIALKNSRATSHPLYCYEIFEKNPDFESRYDLIILFDVLEHAENDVEFLSARCSICLTGATFWQTSLLRRLSIRGTTLQPVIFDGITETACVGSWKIVI